MTVPSRAPAQTKAHFSLCPNSLQCMFASDGDEEASLVAIRPPLRGSAFRALEAALLSRVFIA